ncbi:MAG TPA: ATP-binding protein [bacterium]|nr:ATP-binding protein [bacterium]
MKEFSPREQELLERLDWFVKLRWLFLLGLAALIFFSVRVFGLELDLHAIGPIAAAVLLYNIGFFVLHLFQSRFKRTPLSLRIEANLQIGLDLLALVLLIHVSGGIENPFIFFFIFHMIMGSILLSGRDIWYHAGATVFLLFLLLGLSYLGVISHYHIRGFASADLWNNEPYILAGAVAFGTTILMTVYMTNSITRSVRHRQDELLLAKGQIENKSRELEQANRELIRQQNLLVRSEKLASLGKLSAGVAHELNSPLTGIMNFSYFIRDACPEKEQVQLDVAVVIRETERCKKIIKGLLDFARQSEPEKRENDVLEILKKTIALVENHKDFREIEIIKDFDSGLPRLMLDRDQVQQVFMNLIVNAEEAMNGAGTLYVRAKPGPDGQSVVIMFRDNGPGMDEDTMRKIFDPFFTTKEMGTGLGLSVSMGIIVNHGGELEVESKKGGGACFTITLPANSGAGGRAAA